MDSKYIRLGYDAEYESSITVWTVATNVTLIDGRIAPYDDVQPGDIIELAPGTRSRIVIKNIQGTSSKSIVIRNGNGLVDFNNPAYETAIYFQNCKYFRFTGTGSDDYTYGIKCSNGMTYGILFGYKTERFEFDHLEFTKFSTLNNICIHGYTAETLSPNYDYDGDGDIDEDDGIINRSTHTDHDFHIHDCYFHGGLGTDDIYLAIYVGTSNWDTSNQPEVEGCNIHDNICENIYHKTIQCGSIVTGMDVHHNTLIRCATGGVFGTGEDPCGLSLARGNRGIVHHNWLQDIGGFAISFLGRGVKIYDNVIIRSGYLGTYYESAIAFGADYTTTDTSYVLNNTIVDTLSWGIQFSDFVDGPVYIQNNIFVNCPDGDTYNVPAGSTVDHNYSTDTIDDVAFTDHDNDIYTLTAGSPARNVGADMSGYGVLDDYAGTARPKGAAYDEGAYEYNE